MIEKLEAISNNLKQQNRNYENRNQAQLESHKHRGDKGFEAAKFYQAQLAQLKEIAEKMIKILKTSDIEDEDEELEDVLMTYAEWCKQTRENES